MANEVEVLESEPVVEETVQPVEASETPETAAPTAPVEGTTDDATVSARTRDEKGRFAPKTDGSPATDPASAAVPAPATPPASVVSSPPVPAGEPFVFRADGQKIPIPGSTVDSEGHLRIPSGQVPAVRQLLAEGMAHRGSWRQREADYKQQIEQASAVEKARADKYNHAAVFLFDKVNDPNWLQALVNDPERELALLKRELGLELKTREIATPQPVAVQAPQVPDEQQVEQAARSVLEEEVEMLLESPLARSVYTAEERETVMKRYQRRIGAYFVEHEGGPALDRHALKEDFEDELNQRKQVREQLTATAKAKEFNDKRNQPPANVPPVVSTKGPGGNATAPKKYDTREAWRKSMGMN